MRKDANKDTRRGGDKHAGKHPSKSGGQARDKTADDNGPKRSPHGGAHSAPKSGLAQHSRQRPAKQEGFRPIDGKPRVWERKDRPSFDKGATGFDKGATGFDKGATGKNRPSFSKRAAFGKSEGAGAERSAAHRERPAHGRDLPDGGKDRGGKDRGSEDRASKNRDGKERPFVARERPPGRRDRPEGNRERPLFGRDRSKDQGDRERPAGSRDRPEGGRERPSGNRDRHEDRRERPLFGKERSEGAKERPAHRPFGANDRPPHRPIGTKERPAKGRERPVRGREAVVEAPATGAPIGTMRIAKAMARAGLCSRRDAERWIEEGRVSVNGRVLLTPAFEVGTNDRVMIDGEPMPDAEPVRLWRYHKPRGMVTSHKDPEGRPTVFDNLPSDLPRVISIGRLDFNTEGLLLLTTDGALARHLELPATGWLRRYRVRARGRITQATLNTLKEGVTIEGVNYGPIEATIDSEHGANIWLTVGLREGKNREIRKIMAHLELDVGRLIRVSFGPFQLLDLEPGTVEPIKRRVLAEQLGPRLSRELGVVVGTEAEDRPSPGRKPVAGRDSHRKALGGKPTDRKPAKVALRPPIDDEDE